MEEKSKMLVNMELSGSHEQLNETFEALGKITNIQILPRPIPGGWPVPVMEFVNRKWLEKLSVIAKEESRFLPQFPTDPCGGRKFLHMHLGDNIVVLNRDEFKEFTNQIATHLVNELIVNMDYDSVVDNIGSLAIDTVPLPE